MMIRLVTRVLVLATFAGIRIDAEEQVFTLELPEVNLSIGESERLELQHEFISRLRLTIRRSPSQVRYGDILTRINGVGANTIMTQTGSSDSITCEFDLHYRPGFELHRGRNSFEAAFVDYYGRTHYAAFLLDVPAKKPNRTPYQIDIEVVRAASVEPPVLVIEEPSGPVSENRKSVLIRGYFEYPDNDLSLQIDGFPVALKRRKSAGRRDLLLVQAQSVLMFEHSVELNQEAEAIVLEARTPLRGSVMATIPITTADVPVGEPAERYAVVIGVSHYRNASSALPNLKFADDDAISIRDLLVTAGGFRPENIFTLLNEDATIRQMRTALTTFLTKPERDDLVFIFFAGHGAADPNNPIDHYFLSHDADPLNMGATAFPMWQLRDVFARTLRADRVITLADACHSAGVTETEGTVNLVSQSFVMHGAARGRAVLMASDLGESSYEAAKWGGGHGVFTSFVLAGAAGSADYDADGWISVDELFEYVKQEVTEETGGQQNPVSRPGQMGSQRIFEVK